MSSGIFFGAPWGKPLKAISFFTVAMLLAVVALGLLTGPRGGVDGVIWLGSMAAFPVLVIFLTLPFAVRGYMLTRETLFIKRMGWYSRIDLRGLEAIEIDPKATAGSIRTFGNGGFFGFTGWYWSKKFRAFQVFATDLRLSVVLRFPKRVIIITPDNPEVFVRDLKMLRGM
jgi:hypothetical protein